MPRYVVSTLPKADMNRIADAMRQRGAIIIGVNPTPRSKRTSGRFYLECSKELAAQLQKTKGVKYFEEEIPHRPVSR